MSEISTEETSTHEPPVAAENKNETFFKNYCAERDPNARLNLAKTYLTNDAGDIWLYLYSSLNQEMPKISQENEEVVDQLSDQVKAEHESGEENVFVRRLTEYIELSQNQFPFKALLKTSDLPTPQHLKEALLTEMQKSADASWQEFEKSLDVEADPDLISWFRNMIDSNKIMVYRTNGEKNILQSYLAYGKNDMLIICPDIIPSNMAGAMFLLSLAHERGHYYLNHSDQDISSFGDTEMVLSEFFAMMEENREYDLANDKFRASVRDKNSYDMSVSSDEVAIGNAIPNSNILPRFSPGKIGVTLLRAYKHAIVQLSYSEKVRTVKNMLSLGKNKEDIKKAIEDMGKPKPTMLDAKEMGWRKVAK